MIVETGIIKERPGTRDSGQNGRKGNRYFDTGRPLDVRAREFNEEFRVRANRLTEYRRLVKEFDPAVPDKPKFAERVLTRWQLPFSDQGFALAQSMFKSRLESAEKAFELFQQPLSDRNFARAVAESRNKSLEESNRVHAETENKHKIRLGPTVPGKKLVEAFLPSGKAIYLPILKAETLRQFLIVEPGSPVKINELAESTNTHANIVSTRVSQINPKLDGEAEIFNIGNTGGGSGRAVYVFRYLQKGQKTEAQESRADKEIEGKTARCTLSSREVVYLMPQIAEFLRFIYESSMSNNVTTTAQLREKFPGEDIAKITRRARRQTRGTRLKLVSPKKGNESPWKVYESIPKPEAKLTQANT